MPAVPMAYIRKFFVSAYAWRFQDAEGDTPLQWLRDEQAEAFDASLAEHVRQKQEEAYDLGVETALNHAKCNDDGITLNLVTFDGDPWPHPYRKEDDGTDHSHG